MKVNSGNLRSLNTRFKGYLEGKKIDEFMETFKINFAAGHWCAGGFTDRFASGGYNPGLDDSITAQIERVAEAGVKGIEFHEQVFIDENYRKDPSKISEVKDALKKFKLVPTNMNTNLFTDPKWKLGGVTNVNKAIREDAMAVALQGVEIAREVGCSSVALWPGSDGWDYNFEVNYGGILERFIKACVKINRKAKSLGLRFGIEAKLHEPREGNMVIPTTHLAAMVAREVNEVCGGRNMGVAVDYGHEQMYAVDPGFTLYAVQRLGVQVVNFHLNNAKVHSNDEDRVAGTGDNWRLADFCYAAIDTGYSGWFGEDQFTYRLEPIKAMSLSRELFANVMKKALMIYARKDELEKARATGDAGRVIDVVKKILV
ncbi:sugar isomerase [Candidatus Desantisbacteria bacterium CG_4_10_14_0_8_um_filter_48_22]|uniref:Sugar isomerase n=1 Tax=Candidatus Desantisbacteria bacterium CG_4_10_14_0_8_um_filter_48_22 TaxID=1974543 RepID=A0A2M7SAX2_9BACT|nr:MAG: sugar isomerase [Candidatus Desantisbacteria bacterium CG1_02_49_89]PIV55303.1 MAG: sugar isomerase [Candidatus Desantisbacteria bacterium CG02_land_8_20_14_3_00_49_13]PIZ16658.1 MAG: sugar isomerase [Candidatus Desantisbacteria bacterium CG_4_10_14_0_8_um_filter_48_22]PJB28965.1 MAG: sugar isomerase [Candidatus Desantisbacteria bacterium CG_4_9_14_3_um_filter_50_7]